MNELVLLRLDIHDALAIAHAAANAHQHAKRRFDAVSGRFARFQMRMIDLRIGVPLNGTQLAAAGWFRRRINMPIRFGACDTPPCPKCQNIMRVSRRAPHPIRGYDYELQTFTCRICQHQIEREADIGGEVEA